MQKAWPGALGAVLALPWLAGPLLMRVAMVAGGVALSYWGTPTVARLLHTDNAEGLTGFLVGLFGMALVAKVHEIIAAIKGEGVIGTLTEWLKKKLGV